MTTAVHVLPKTVAVGTTGGTRAVPANWSHTDSPDPGPILADTLMLPLEVANA